MDTGVDGTEDLSTSLEYAESDLDNSGESDTGENNEEGRLPLGFFIHHVPTQSPIDGRSPLVALSVSLASESSGCMTGGTVVSIVGVRSGDESLS